MTARRTLTSLIVTLGLAASNWAADPPEDKGSGLPDLPAAIRATKGCLGVETAKTDSGKMVIFAWFEDKQAALAWYNSDVHRQVMKQIFGAEAGKGERKPLADVPEDSGPIMAIASVTLKGEPTKENPLPFKQISIELYKPLGGGISIGGKFSPEKMKVPAAGGNKPAK